MDAKVENKEEKTCECNECNCEEECKCDEECTCEKEQKKEKKKDKYKKQIQELEEKIKGYEEKSLRDKAEMINYRRRKEEETSKMLKYCNEDLIKQLLPVIDNFERAIKMDDDNLEDEVSKFLSGFKMIYSNLALTLQNFEVKAIDGANKPFDPVYHDAVMTEHRDDLEPGMIIEVLQKGYMLKDRVIRPAMVKVSE
jgi:molecular chaperone GrpE